MRNPAEITGLGLWVLAAILLIATSAVAQTAPQDPLALIEQYESGGQNIPQQTGATNSTASGLYQITNTTQNTEVAPNTGLPTVGPGTPYPDGVMDLTPEQQQQAAAYLYQTYGFQPWVCAGCDAPLANAVAAAGGSSAFQLTPAEQALLSGTTTGSDAGTPGTIGAAAQAQGITAGTSMGWFAWLWLEYTGAIQAPLAQTLDTIQGTLSPGVLGAVTVSLIIGGYLFAINLRELPQTLVRLVLAGVVVLLIGVGSALYEEYFVGLFTAAPTWFSQGILGSTSTNPASGFDDAIHGFNAFSSNNHWSIITQTSEAFQSMGLFILSALLFWVAILILAGAWFISQVLTQLLLVIGPIFVLCLLFDVTRVMFIRWVSELGHQAIVVLGIDLLVTLILKVIQQAFAQVPNTGNGGVSAFENLLGLSGVIFLLSFTVPVFFVVLDNIFAATGVPTLTTPARLIGDATGAIMGYAAGGAAVAGRAAGAVAETAGEIVTGVGASAIRRMSSAGASLSGGGP